MRKMDLETMLQLKKQAAREFDRAKLTKGYIELALSLKRKIRTQPSAKLTAANKVYSMIKAGR